MLPVQKTTHIQILICDSAQWAFLTASNAFARLCCSTSNMKYFLTQIVSNSALRRIGCAPAQFLGPVIALNRDQVCAHCKSLENFCLFQNLSFSLANQVWMYFVPLFFFFELPMLPYVNFGQIFSYLKIIRKCVNLLSCSTNFIKLLFLNTSQLNATHLNTSQQI